MEMQSNKGIKYFVYLRKSSESEDRQMASIESQRAEMESVASQCGLNVAETFSESQTAKEPGRPVFEEMLSRIRKGEAQGILCWKLNRLARNPVDGGQISWMLQQGVIQHIQTAGRSYYPNDNVIMMAVELGMANQFVRDLSVDSKRGLKSKAERGWYPAYATLGYMHNPYKQKGEKEVINDPERRDLTRKMFDVMLEGKTSPKRIVEIANDEWGLRTRKGNKVSRSNIYRIFNDTFYYGEFEYPKGSGNWYQGAHEPMITREEFDIIQVMLKDKARPRKRTCEFAYRGPIKCGECGAAVTAERKIKRQKNGVVRFYTYYHCTKRKDPGCSQGSIEEKVLERQIAKILGTFSVPEEFYEWAMEVLRENNKIEARSTEHILRNKRKRYDEVLKTITGIIDMRAKGEIDQEEFTDRRRELVSEKLRLKILLDNADERVNEWLDIAESYLKFASRASEKFLTGNLQEKKHIFATLGSNFILKDKKMSVELAKPLELLTSGAREANRIKDTFEPQEGATLSDFYGKSDLMLREQDSNLRPID
jgi:site-specific DNA recombinase